MSRAVMSLRDYSAEITQFAVNSIALTSANFDAQVTAWTALRTAAQALSLGVTSQHTLSQVVAGTSLLPTDPFAQREMKWLIPYVGNTSGKLYRVELGTADLGGTHLLEGTDQADMSDADWQAFVTAFEAFVRAPDNITEEVTVQPARFVGRST